MPLILHEGDNTEVLCETCGSNMHHAFEKEVIEPRFSKPYEKRNWYYACANPDCPELNKRKPLQAV